MGDSVRVSNNQRLDKTDFDALQALVYRGLREAIGGMLGGSAGALTPFVWSKSNADGVYLLSIEKMVVAWSKTATGGTRIEDRDADPAVNVGVQYESRIVPYDPSENGHQNSPLDYSDARATEMATPGTKPYIWVRPVTVPADTDVRRFWSVATGDETAAATATRNFVRLEFAINEDTPTQGIGETWSAIARVMTWSGNDIARINALSVWDDPDIAGMLQDPGDPEEYTGDNASMAHPLQRMREGSAPRVLSVQNDGSEDDWPQGVRRAFGLPQALQWVYSRIQRHISGGINDPDGTDITSWWELPQISLNGAYARMEATDAAVAANTDAAADAVEAAEAVASAHATLQLQANAASYRQEILCSGVIEYYTAGDYGIGAAGWFSPEGWGIEAVSSGWSGDSDAWTGCTLQFKPSLVTGREAYFISGVQVTPMYNTNRLGQIRRFDLLPVLESNQTPAEIINGDPPPALGTYDGAGTLSSGKHGVELVMLETTAVAGPALQQAAPTVEANVLANRWSVTVFISAYTGNETGI